MSVLQSDLSSGGEWPGSNLFGIGKIRRDGKEGLGDELGRRRRFKMAWKKKNSNQGHEERAAV